MLVKGGSSDSFATPNEHLNGIYITVLQTSVRISYNEREKEMYCNVLRVILGSIVALFSPFRLSL